MIALRPYQQRSIDLLYQWWVAHPNGLPICTLPTGSGKSVVIAELCRLLFDTWPEHHPRTVVLVPSKELAEQNAQKLRAMLPTHLSVGYYSASLGPKQQSADVIVATIGSIFRDAHLLGSIKCVVIDECHLVNPSGIEAGRYRQFLSRLARINQFCTVGFTATPFRGNGVWLTDGDNPLFTGVACTVTVQELLDDGFLSALIRPMDAVTTRIDVDDIKTTNGDYNIKELSERVESYLQAAADEACIKAADRKKWIAFCPTVANAQSLVTLLNDRSIQAALVCGETPKKEREALIGDFRNGRIRCLVTVLALATGFDVPDVDCILWLRPTKSPVLYVQGAGRGMRIANDKANCLWLDFSDTTERLGPVDAIKGRKKRAGNPDQDAPYAICPGCGEVVRPASALICPSCGMQMREEEAKEVRKASNAAVMLNQLATSKINTYPVTNVSYSLHQKEGKPDSLRVDYSSGFRRIASEWVCLDHTGFARAKAEQWFITHNPDGFKAIPGTTQQAMEWIDGGFTPRCPASITVNEGGKFSEIIKYHWQTNENTTPSLDH